VQKRRHRLNPGLIAWACLHAAGLLRACLPAAGLLRACLPAAGLLRACLYAAGLLLFTLFSCATYRDPSGVFTDYPDLQRVELFLRQECAAYPGLAELHTLGVTAQGRTIWALRVCRSGRDPVPGFNRASNPGPGPGYAGKNKSRLLVTALTHGDEWISLPAVLYTIHMLVSGYDHDAEIRRILDNVELWFVPVVNPDGYAYARNTDRAWRKNRAGHGGNAVGVDINRNFDFMWNARGGFSRDPDSRFYMGPGPASEPETRALQDLAGRMFFTAALDIHSYGRRILYPWGHTRTPCAPDRLFRALAADMAAAIAAGGGGSYTPSRMSRIYPAGLPTGTLMDYLYGTYGTVALTIELPPDSAEQGGANPPPADLPAAGGELFDAVRFLSMWALVYVNTDAS
jgi:hypothetical protein